MLSPAPQAVLTLRENPPYARRFGYAIYRQDICACAHVSSVTLCRVMHLVKRVAHRIFEGLVDARFTPEERILILHPFVIADRNSSRVSENVGITITPPAS